MINPILKYDSENFEEILTFFNEFSIAYFENVSNIPPHKPYNNNLETSKILSIGVGAKRAFQLFIDKYADFIPSGSNSNKFWGYVVGGSTPASLIGDWLTSSFDGLDSCDISEQIEKDTVLLFQKLLKIPNDFNGSFVSGATLSNFMGLNVGRQWIGNIYGYDIANQGANILEHLQILCSSPHSSIYKSASMSGIGKKNIILINSKKNRESIDISELEKKIIEFKNCIVVASAGTVNTGDFDDFKAISILKKKYNFWLHIDATFGAFASCTSKYNHLLNGWHSADSITIDTHKWLNVPYDSAVFFTKHILEQVQVFQNNNSPYLNSDPTDYINLIPQNSRRMRSIPIWISIMAYGEVGYQNIVENNIECAKFFGKLLKKSIQFQLLSKVHLNIVCFTLKNTTDKELITFLEKVNASGKVFLTSTTYKDKLAIRAAFCNWRTTNKDILEVYEIMCDMSQIY